MNSIPKTSRRRGMSSVLAMMFLVLFSSLAVGFFAATTTAVQVSNNETHARQALLTAESGMAFMRYIMGYVDVPQSTPTDQAWTAFCTQIKAQLDGTANINNTTLTLPAGEVMTLPAMSTVAGGPTFTATLTHSGEQILVKVVGSGPDPVVKRTIQMAYARAQRASAIFDYGVATKSAVSMAGNAKVTGAAGALARGSVLSMTASATPLSMIGSASISGDFSYTNAAGTNSYGANGTIAGYKSNNSEFPNHVHAGVTAPDFPEIDTSAFTAFVPSATAPAGPQVITTANPAGTSFTNIRIKAGANPKFNANTIIRGVIYIETPNKVTFNGNVTIQGVIAVQNNPTGTVTTNQIKFSGNLTHQGVDTLPVATFGDLTKLKGSFLLAPKFDVIMTGNTNQVGGSIVTGQLDISGNAGATVNGTVINLEDTGVNLTGNADITISSTGTTNYPAGVFFGSHYAPLADTYQELP